MAISAALRRPPPVDTFQVVPTEHNNDCCMLRYPYVPYLRASNGACRLP